jgi:hypothetical protein
MDGQSCQGQNPGNEYTCLKVFGMFVATALAVETTEVVTTNFIVTGCNAEPLIAEGSCEPYR